MPTENGMLFETTQGNSIAVVLVPVPPDTVALAKRTESR